jgi:hypothetical protein
VIMVSPNSDLVLADYLRCRHRDLDTECQEVIVI